MAGEKAAGGASQGETRSWLGVMFECCNVYLRIHKRKDGTAYEGRCPRCYRPVKVKVGQGGTNHRIFRAR